ncbi:MAG: hypothetical protein AB1711_03735 [Thermodesulfobacteriota bacterium]
MPYYKKYGFFIPAEIEPCWDDRENKVFAGIIMERQNDLLVRVLKSQAQISVKAGDDLWVARENFTMI